MKNYKRLTDERTSVCDARYCENDNCSKCSAQLNYQRLAELEDKIESGELCDREEVRKETAKEIILRINQVRKTHLGHLRSEIYMICREYGIDWEDEE